MARYNQIYDWEKWFDKDKFTLIQGTHYHVGHGSMAQQVRNAAKARGLGVSIVEGINRLVVRVLRKRRAG